MLKTEELVNRLAEFAVGRIAVRDFEDWFVRASWNAHAWAPPALREAVYSLELVLAEYSNRHVGNSYLRAFAGDIARALEESSNTILPSPVGARMAAADLVNARIAATPVLAAA